jgi:RNA polymerase sigma factor (sigma-70 family)
MNANTIAKLVHFQNTGLGFDDFWQDVEDHVSRVVRGRLRKHFVRGWKTFDDLAAVEEVVQTVRIRIFRGAGPGGKGQFKPAPSGCRVDGLKRWMFPILQNETINYCRTYRSGGRGKVKTGTFTDLGLNEQPGGESILKAPLPVDPDRFERVAIVNDCVQSLPSSLQKLFRIRFVEGLSQRKAAGPLKVTAPTVSRREKALREAVCRWLDDRGIDGAELLG